MTHEQLVEKAAAWLRRQKHVVVVTEMAGQPEEPDALGFKASFSTLIECKASRADFLADKAKPAVRMGDWRYYLVPGGLVEAEECPQGWGLLYVHERTIHTVVEAPQQYEKNWRAEQGLLLSCLRRVFNTAPRGISVKCYKWETNNRATLGVAE